MMPVDAGLAEPLLRGLHELVGVLGLRLDRGRRRPSTRVLSSVRTALLRSRRRSFWRLRFFCDLMLATCPFLG